MLLKFEETLLSHRHDQTINLPKTLVYDEGNEQLMAPKPKGEGKNPKSTKLLNFVERKRRRRRKTCLRIEDWGLWIVD